MSVLIKGMEMPTDCRMCIALKYEPKSGLTYCGLVGFALATDFKTIPFDGRSKYCPLVPVPEHGRLIDADAEVAVNVTMLPGGKCKVSFIAPTVIPADREENP